MGVIGHLASYIGADEQGLSLLFTLFAGYPLAGIYRFLVWKQTPTLQYMYFVVCGVGLMLFNYGFHIGHSLFSITAAYVICRFFKGTQLSIILAYVVLFGHLMVGYWLAESDVYDISWTTPHCILTLRLIGLVMDVYDGQQPEHTVRADRRNVMIKDPPSLLETAAYTYFFGSLLIGPQYPLQRLRDLVNGKFLKNGELRDSLKSSLFRLAMGIAYLIVHQWGDLWFGGLNNYVLTEHFLTKTFFAKLFWILVWFKLTLMKYQAVWLTTEGSCILSTLAFNGEHQKGDADADASEIGEVNERWDGCRDMHLVRFEFGIGCNSYVDAFNTNTNQWVKVHIFQRLRFLGNKNASHLLTLLFLALWHGYHLGYFILFFYEFLCVMSEQQLVKLIDRIPPLSKTLNAVPPIRYFLGKLILMLMTSYGFLSFGMIKKERWFKIYTSVYFYWWILLLIVWPIMYRVGMAAYPSTKPKSNGKNEDSVPVEELKKEL